MTYDEVKNMPPTNYEYFKYTTLAKSRGEKVLPKSKWDKKIAITKLRRKWL